MAVFTVGVTVGTGEKDAEGKYLNSREIQVPQIESLEDIPQLEKEWKLAPERVIYFTNESIRIRGQDAARLVIKADANAADEKLAEAIKARFAKEGRSTGVSRGVTDMQILQFVAKLNQKDPAKFGEPLAKLQSAFSNPDTAVSVFAEVRKRLAAAGITTDAIKATLAS